MQEEPINKNKPKSHFVYFLIRKGKTAGYPVLKLRLKVISAPYIMHLIPYMLKVLTKTYSTLPLFVSNHRDADYARFHLNEQACLFALL